MSESKIQKEINLLKSFAISIAGEDKEGQYNTEFVNKTLKAANENPYKTFKNKKDFLKLLKK